MDKGKFSAGYFLIAMIVAWLFAEYVYKPYVESKSEVPYSEFLADLDSKQIESVDITDSRITYALKSNVGEYLFYTVTPISGTEKTCGIKLSDPSVETEIFYSDNVKDDMIIIKTCKGHY